MKVKGVLNIDYFSKEETFSLDIVDKYDNVVVKGNTYSKDKFKDGVTINTHISMLTVSLNCKGNWEEQYYDIIYKTEQGYIKI